MGNRKEVKNFGHCGILYRSGRPRPQDYAQVKTQYGVGTVINLEAEFNDSDIVLKSGLGYIWIPLKDKEKPPAEFARTFLRTISGTGGPYWVHCEGGRHRTGAAVAIYRIAMCDWKFDQAYEEMKKYGFYSIFGHGGFKDYVEEFSKLPKWKTDQAL